MKIGDRVYVHGYVDEIRKDTVIIRNEGGYFGTVKSEIVEAQKAEDIVSVIRCKDCKYYQFGRHFNDFRFCYRLLDNKGNHVGYNFLPNDFCSRAERREE